MSSLHIPPFAGTGAGRALGEHRGDRNAQGLRGDGGSRTQAIAIGGGARVGRTEDGRPTSRQLSRSYFVPRSLAGYERHLRQIQCEGYLQRQSRTTGTWRRRWFLLKDGYLSYFQDRDEAEVYRSDTDAQLHHHPSSQRQLSLDCVEAVRTEEDIGPLVIRVISSHRDDLVLRAESKEDMNEWLFGFHRALASIIARYMENRGMRGEDEVDWKAATHSGGGYDGADGSQRGADGKQRSGSLGAKKDPFRATVPSEIRKVLGHGHGRARRLSLRQWRLANGSGRNGANHRPRALNGSYDGSFGSGGGGAHCLGGHKACGGVPRTSGGPSCGGPHGLSPAYGGDAAPRGEGSGSCSLKMNNIPNSKGNNSSHGNSINAPPPKPSPHPANRHQSSMEERCRRTESMGSCDGSGRRTWYGGLFGGGGVGVGGRELHAMGRVGMLRAVSAGYELGGGGGQADGDDYFDGVLDDYCEQGDGDLELSDEDYGEQENQPQASPSTTAAAAAAAVLYGSSGDEGGREWGRAHNVAQDSSAESGQGSTSDDNTMEGPGSVLTSQEAFGLGLGMDVEAHSFLQQDSRTPKYIPPNESDIKGLAGTGGMGGGGEKYIPPAMRAAARAKANAEAGRKGGGGNDRDRGASSAVPIPHQIDVSSGNIHDASDRRQDGQDQGVFATAGIGKLGTSHTPLACGGASQLLALSTPANSDAMVDPQFVGGSGGGAACAVLPNGATLPWSSATKAHYYTGDYHSRRPCNPDSACNAKGGGCGGGSSARHSANPLRIASAGPTRGGRETGGCGAYDGGLEEHGGLATDTEGGPSHRIDGSGPGREGLWWSCGAWSIIGRREKQEDRFCVMPDFSKSLPSRNRARGRTASSNSEPPMVSSLSSATSKSGSFVGEAPSASVAAVAAAPAAGGENLSSQPSFESSYCSTITTTEEVAEKDVGDGEKGLGEEAQGFFGVYDGHCGSEAVQFVRDRLHIMVGGHASFVEEPDRAIREAFLATDEAFLTLAAERDWFSGTTVLVALMRGRKLLVGNVGDGEAVLCRGEQAVHMSPVHNPGRADESRRILDANGWVTTEQELFLRQLKQMDLNDPQIRMAATEHVRWTTITRVCGELAVSRSIGDRDFKGFTRRRLEQGTDGVAPLEMTVFSWPHGHSGEFRDDLLTAEPEFQSTEIGPEDEFLLMACDGLWDVLGKQEAVDHARAFFDEGLCAQAVAERMCELAYRMGTSDNVTAVVVQFHHSRPSFL